MPVQLSQNDVADLKRQGYSDDQIRGAVQEIERDELSGGGVKEQRKQSRHSAFGSQADGDIIKLQLELNDLLERAEHILRGDIIGFDQGHIIWEKNPDPKGNALNEFGVSLIMKVISNYINRNTILSDYEKEEINYKVLDFGKELNNLIFMKYEEMGMDDEDKRKEYPMLVREMVDIVHSCYKRALDGGERRSLREMISVQQSHSSMAQGGVTVNQQGQQSRSRGILNPMRYIAGKNF